MSNWDTYDFGYTERDPTLGSYTYRGRRVTIFRDLHTTYHAQVKLRSGPVHYGHKDLDTVRDYMQKLVDQEVALRTRTPWSALIVWVLV